MPTVLPEAERFARALAALPHRRPRFNRLLVYEADLIHSATAYCGTEPRDRRKAAVFFWSR